MKEKAYRWWFSLPSRMRQNLRGDARMTLDKLLSLYIATHADIH